MSSAAELSLGALGVLKATYVLLFIAIILISLLDSLLFLLIFCPQIIERLLNFIWKICYTNVLRIWSLSTFILILPCTLSLSVSSTSPSSPSLLLMDFYQQLKIFVVLFFFYFSNTNISHFFGYQIFLSFHFSVVMSRRLYLWFL